MNRRFHLVWLHALWVIVLLLLAGACSGLTPEPAPPSDLTITPDMDATYTAAVETVLAQLTLDARRETETPQQMESSPTSTETPFPTPTPLPTDTPEPTSTPTSEEATPTQTAAPAITPSPAPQDPRADLGSPTLHERFETGDRWALFTDNHTSMEVKDGQLEMTAFNPDFWNGWAFTTGTAGDLYLEMTAEHRSCSGLDRFGMIFRAPDSNRGYLYGFSCDGRYAIWIWNGQTEIRLAEWTSSQHILAGEGQTNRLGVYAQGDQIALYANGHLLTELVDRTFSEGRFGVFIGAAATSNYTVLVDEISYWELP
jgi:hypothetical protein